MFFKSLMFVLLVALELKCAIGTKKLFEQICSTNTDCNEELGLSCQSKVCKCAANGATVYSLSKNRCVGAAGRECLQVQDKNLTLCVENSICRDYEYMHLCTCNDGYYQSKDGNCYTIAKYGENCLEEEFSCGDTMTTSVSCIDRKCRCVLGEENQQFDPIDKKCTSYAGGRCLFHYFQSCTKNSYCGEFHENIDGASFVAGHKCICAPGYSPSIKTRQCFARYGTDCSINNPCNYDEFLGCLNGKCQCRNPLNEVFNERTGQCEILVGSVCDLESSQKCVKNSECVLEKSTNSTRHGRCKCLTDGFSVTPMSTCLLDINQKCDENNICNYFNSLACVLANNSNQPTCNCIDSYLSYDKVTKACVSLVGLPCGSVALYDVQGNTAADKSEIVVLCESNAICSKVGVVGSHGISNGKRICKPSGSKH